MPYIGIANIKKRSLEENAEIRRREQLNNPTPAEIVFGVIAKNCNIPLEPQKIIYRYRRGKHVSYAIPDYTDNKRKIIFELDGKHHYTKEEDIKHDAQRDKWLTEERRYTIYRIPNDLVVEEANKLFKDIYNI